MILRLHRRAVAEIDHEVDYYEAKQAGLGAEAARALGITRQTLAGHFARIGMATQRVGSEELWHTTTSRPRRRVPCRRHAKARQP